MLSYFHMSNYRAQFSREHGQQAIEEIKERARKIKETVPIDPKSGTKDLPEHLLHTALGKEMQKIEETLKTDFVGRTMALIGFESEYRRRLQDTFAQKGYEMRREELKKSVEMYNRRLQEIAEHNPLPVEERGLLSEENVVRMGLKDYLLLSKRLSGNYFSHVVRYGVREQTLKGDGGHTAGEGTFVDHFTNILERGELRSCMTNILERDPYVVSMVRDSLRQEMKKNPQLKKEDFVHFFVKTMKHLESNLMPGDHSTVHVAEDDMLGGYYGAEIDNDIFFYFPAEIIAENYTIGGYNGGGKHNNVTIWNKGKGVPIEAGILCIPIRTVDAKTGSKYKLDSEGKPIKNKSGDGFERVDPQSKDAVSSKDFWEDYFENHQDQRPNKILFYDSDTEVVGPQQFNTSSGNIERVPKKPRDRNKEAYFDGTDPVYKQFLEQSLSELEKIAGEVFDEEKA